MPLLRFCHSPGHRRAEAVAKVEKTPCAEDDVRRRPKSARTRGRPRGLPERRQSLGAADDLSRQRPAIASRRLAEAAMPFSGLAGLGAARHACDPQDLWRQERRAMSIDFLITSLIVVASPGIGVLFTLAAGLSRGWRASVIAAFGCTLGIVPHMLAAVMGLAALMHTSALAFQILKYLGVAYLLYMAWSTLKEQGALKVETELGARSATQVIVSAILLNLLNPKLSIFFLAFLPQFVHADEPQPLAHMLGLSAVFMLITFVVFVGYGVFAAVVVRAC